jgi:V8-like Glu-specific endopeptidase
MNEKQYIFPIVTTNNTDGCGFFVGYLFITAGHIIEMAENPYIKIDNQRILLNNHIKCENDVNADGYDIAIYEIPGINSPFVFADKEPEKGLVLTSMSYRTIAEGTEFVTSNAIVNDVQEGNYFGADTEIQLKSGSSGSPVFYKNKVIGIMSRGNMNDDGSSCNPSLSLKFCLFLSSKSILKLISQI